MPRKKAETWSEVELADFRLRAGQHSWQPEASDLESFPDGAFEIRGEGAATVPAGTRVAPSVRLRTSAGLKELVLPEGVVQRVE